MVRPEFSLDGFRNCVEINRGGSAVVYRAEQPEFGRSVAIKVLSSFSDQEMVDQFNNERITMGQLSHAQGIVSVYASGTTEHDEPYLVLPFYEAGSLQDRIERSGPLPWRSACKHIISICRAVGFAHKKGVYHRDIKPANLLIADDGNIHIADFGIASLALADPEQQLLCTPAYAPPEVLAGEMIGKAEAIDVYGLAATLWALLAGRPPFVEYYSDDSFSEGYTVRAWATTAQLESFASVVSDRPVGDLRAEIPEPICDVLEQAMAKSPEDRFASINAFGKALGHAVRIAAEELVLTDKLSIPASARAVHAGVGSSFGSQRVGTPTFRPPSPTTGIETQQLPVTPSTGETIDITSDHSLSDPPDDEEDVFRPEASTDEQSARKQMSSLLVLSGLVVVVVIAGVAILLLSRPDGSAPGGVVQNYVGSSLSDVEVEAKQAGWDVQTARRRQDDTVPGQVIEQTQGSGTRLKGGGILQVVVSDGPELRTVPDVVGLSQEQAERQIRDANLVVGRVTEESSDSVDRGLVLSLSQAGQMIAVEYETGTRIDLIVSSGPKEVVVPKVRTLEDAETVLELDLGFTIVTSEEFSEDVAEGDVIRTDPGAGETAKAGEEITVVISKGSARRTVPKVVGDKPAEAKRKLEEAGFVVVSKDQGPKNCRVKLVGNGKTECDNYKRGVVWRASPGGGEADAGSEVVIYVRG